MSLFKIIFDIALSLAFMALPVICVGMYGTRTLCCSLSEMSGLANHVNRELREAERRLPCPTGRCAGGVAADRRVRVEAPATDQARAAVARMGGTARENAASTATAAPEHLTARAESLDRMVGEFISLVEDRAAAAVNDNGHFLESGNRRPRPAFLRAAHVSYPGCPARNRRCEVRMIRAGEVRTPGGGASL